MSRAPSSQSEERMRIRRRRLRPVVTAAAVAAAAAVLAVSPRAARAQAAPAAPANGTDGDRTAQAGEHYGRGVRLYQEEDFAAAAIEFKRAYELAPNFAVLYNIGQSYYSLRDYASAVEALERYERDGGAQIPAERRAQIEREIRELRGRVAHVSVMPSVEGADVSLDDAPLPRGPDGTPRLIGAGRHRFTASKAGYAPATRIVDVAGGDTLTVKLDLVPESQTASTGALAPTEHANYTGAVLTGIVGVAGIGVGTVFGVLTLQNKSALDGECTGAKLCPAHAQSDIDAYGRNGAIAGVGLGVGAVGVVLATYFFFHERGKEGSSPPPSAQAGARTQATVMPFVGPGAAGVVGSF
jgi:hypothetical protein